MRRLVALDLAPGAAFVQALQRCFDDGDAVLPVDQRLAPPARSDLLAAMGVSAIRTRDEVVEVRGGKPVEDGDAFVVATSGTTGAPRGVVLTHDAVRDSATATSGHLGVSSSDHWLCCLPVAHVGGLSVITRALQTNTALTVHDRFDPDALARAAEEGATLTSLVPTMLWRLDEKVALTFRSILLGGSQIPTARPTNTVATYGMTESGSGVVYEGFPLDGVEVHIDAEGEIFLRGPMLLRCYRDGTDPKDAQGWFATGDAGHFEADGRLVVEGRRAEVIVTGGEKVWPTAVEALLATSEKVRDVAVAGAADPEWGERVVAYVVPTDVENPPGLDELRELVRSNLGPIAAPREMIVVSSLPRTAIGKIRRAQLARDDKLARA